MTSGPPASWTTDIPDNTGIAIFNNNTGGGSYSLANRLDTVGLDVGSQHALQRGHWRQVE